jgi:Na+-translocating ferredoxin:NAD+ oxidoreductase RnfG subunit
MGPKTFKSLLFPILLLCGSLRSEAIQSLDQALKTSFPEADSFLFQSLTLSPSERESLEKDLGSHVFSPACLVVQAKALSKTVGLAMADDELGKHLPISFLVALRIDGKVRRVELLDYREHYGRGIQARAFMAKFEGKGVADPIVVGKDIDAVTGATISSKAVSLGVRKSLHILRRFFPKEAGKK